MKQNIALIFSMSDVRSLLTGHQLYQFGKKTMLKKKLFLLQSMRQQAKIAKKHAHLVVEKMAPLDTVFKIFLRGWKEVFTKVLTHTKFNFVPKL